MTSGRLKLTVGITAVVLFLLFVAAGFVLFGRIAQFSKAETALRALMAERQRLYGKEPFPTAENVEMETAKLRILQEDFISFQDEISRGQPVPEQKTPSMFMSQFWETCQHVADAAKSRGVKLPAEFAAGLETYRRGELPAPPDVPRLFQQMSIATNILAMLYEAGIVEVVKIEREEFDSPAARAAKNATAAPVPTAGPAGGGRPRYGMAPPTPSGTTANPDAGLIPEGALFGKFRFAVEFRATDTAFLDVMNRLARSPMLVVVTSVRVSSPETGVMSVAKPVVEGAVSGAAPGAAALKDEGAGREDRIVSGRESPMNIRLEADVYWFREPAGPQKDGDEKQL